MPYTQRQLDAIIGDGATRVIPRNAPLTLSQRVSESEVRRRVYSYEDAAAKETLTLFLKAWGEIRDHSNAIAEYGNITKLSPGSAASAEWKKRLAFYISDCLETLLNDVAYMVINRVPTAYNAGYYGRAWSIDVSTKLDVMVQTQRHDTRSITDAFGADWRKRTQEPFYESFMMIATKYKQKARQALNTAIINGESVTDANRRIMTLMGLNYETPGVRSLKQAYFEAQSLVRYAIMSASNLGATRLYQENARFEEAVGGIGTGYIVLTAGDGHVCSICLEASREIWSIDVHGLKGPSPPLHPNCRCSPVFVILSRDLIPEDMPPDLTLIEWLRRAGFDHLLSDFMNMSVEKQVTYADI